MTPSSRRTPGTPRTPQTKQAPHTVCTPGTARSRRRQQRRPILTIHNGEGDDGQIVFPQHPEIVVPLSATLANIVLLLQSAWDDNPGVIAGERGFQNGRRMHEEYILRFNTVDRNTVGKYVLRLKDEIEKAFSHLQEPPILLERVHKKGWHLVRAVKLVNLDKNRRPRRRAGDRDRGQPGGQAGMRSGEQSTS